MRTNLQSKSLETKLYFAVFFLFASFMALVIYNVAFDVFVIEESVSDSISISRNFKENAR